MKVAKTTQSPELLLPLSEPCVGDGGGGGGEGGRWVMEWEWVEAGASCEGGG